MMWDQVMERVLQMIEDDDVLAEIYGSHVRAAPGSGEQQIPGLEWTLIGDTEGELWAPMIVQFDQFTHDAAALRQSELALRALFHHQTPQQLGGSPDIQAWTVYEDGNMLSLPDRSTFYGRAIRFRFTPLRRQYALALP